METKTFKSLGCDVPVSVPSSEQEYNDLAKKEGACLEEAIANVVYRSVLASFRSAFVERVESETGIERETKELDKKDSDGNPVVVPAETEADYLRRVRSEKGWQEDNTQLQAWANEVASELEFDPSQRERKPAKPKKLPKKYMEVAKAIFDKGRQDHWASQFGITLTGEEEADIKVMAAAVKRDDEQRTAERYA